MDNYLARQKLMLNEETGNKIKESKILVVGVGAGGNEVLKNLALMGFGHFTIVDFDPIEDSNLSRTTLFTKSDIGKYKSEIAAKSLNEIVLHASPNITSINSKIQDIGKQVFLEHDIIVSCVDTMDARTYINNWAVKVKKPFFEMGFEKFTVQISFFPNESHTDSCLREIIGFGDLSGARLQSCSKLKVKDTELKHIPTIQVASALAGAFIATEIILFLKGESKLRNKMYQYAADTHLGLVIDYPQSKKCHLHEKVEYLEYRSDITPVNTFRDILLKLKKEFDTDFDIRLDEEYIYSFECEECQKEIFVKRYKSEVYDEERWCQSCLSEGKYINDIPINAKWNIVTELNLFNPNHSSYLDLELKEFGVKKNDIITANFLHSNSKKVFVLIN